MKNGEYLYGKRLLEARHPVLLEFLKRELRIKESILEQLAGRSGSESAREAGGRDLPGEGMDPKGTGTVRNRRNDMTCGEIIAQIEKDYPTSCALEWDNVGLLAGRMDKEVKRVYIGLDATDSGDPGGGG